MVAPEEDPVLVKPVPVRDIKDKLLEICRCHPCVTAVLVTLVCRTLNEDAGVVRKPSF